MSAKGVADGMSVQAGLMQESARAEWVRHGGLEELLCVEAS